MKVLHHEWLEVPFICWCSFPWRKVLVGGILGSNMCIGRVSADLNVRRNFECGSQMMKNQRSTWDETTYSSSKTGDFGSEESIFTSIGLKQLHWSKAEIPRDYGCKVLSSRSVIDPDCWTVRRMWVDYCSHKETPKWYLRGKPSEETRKTGTYLNLKSMWASCYEWQHLRGFGSSLATGPNFRVDSIKFLVSYGHI